MVPQENMAATFGYTKYQLFMLNKESIVKIAEVLEDYFDKQVQQELKNNMEIGKNEVKKK